MRILRLLFVFVFLGFLSLNALAQDDENKNDNVFFIVEDMPEYPDGEEALRNDIAALVKYPAKAKENGIQGKVYVSFNVNEKGEIEDAVIARGVDPSLDKEALRVVNELEKTWKPGKQRGVAVKVRYTLPINFALDGGSSKQKKIARGEGSDAIFFIVEDMPEFPGGDEALRKYIANAITYPEIAHTKEIEGKVYVSFVVEKDGSIGNAKIERGVDPSLDKEALRVVKSLPKWKPGKQRGEPVRVQYTVPINFALN
ncbi:energy transducer TonB [Draconibacterium halophilum]|uniref:Energy transducer TonB n=1 Tax=Draconibacterium halophilum TaxID=2706887 RepID=A0A6C0REW0_9BACT|nr:energy transducer TonB [Draconibacterium halophilum]QIA08215.1 energy transducer TonB [Draconibacterium halophilum]